MLSWIIIALAIAVIFGVIKIDQVKSWAIKMEPKAKELLTTIQQWIAAKSAEAKAASDNKKADKQEKNDTDNKPVE